MTGQLSLEGISAGQEPTDRIFLGIFPEAPVADHLARTAQQLRTRHALTGTPLLPERFHVTLFHLGDYFGRPEMLVRTASEAAGTVAMTPFEVQFDRAGSFSGKPGRLPFVLRGNKGLDGLKGFQQNLGVALQQAGLGRFVSSQFIPHITLLYDAKLLPEETVEPVGWTVKEFVLVHSLLGKTRHIQLKHWPLRG